MKNTLQVRELYCPSHFGNTYEVVLDNEMREILTEAKYWGFNRFSDWFDTIDLYNVYEKRHNLFNMPEAMWARKFANFELASRLGFELGLVISPNHVFSDQVTKDNEAVKDAYIFGQLVCPSKPGVTELILENYRRLFKDFSDRGLMPRSLSACPYDYGGCACDRCQPWIITFGKLVMQITELARTFFKNVNADLIGWWWRDEDHTRFTAWANRNARGFFNSLAFHLPYGITDYSVRPIPTDCRERAFVHIAYGETNNRDAYGHYGPPIAPARIEKTVRYLMARGAEGFIAYSEGDYDEINKALLAGLSCGRFSSADEVLRHYAERYLGGDSAGWANCLRSMGDYFTLDSKSVRKMFDPLKRQSKPSWRLEQLEGRLLLAESDAEVRRHTTWNSDRLAAAKRFWDTKERLYRFVWRLGLMRHSFKFDFPAFCPDWMAEYQKQLGKSCDGANWILDKEA